ncbi:MAG: serine/threonine protein kinase [Patiriisocius sp.]|jgi:serine/threonine protein kinase
MDADLAPVYEQVMNAIRPEEVFRELNLVLPQRLLKEHLSKEVDRFLEVLNSTLYSAPEDIEAAEAAREKFDVLYDSALKKAAHGLYSLDGFSSQPAPEHGRKIEVDGVSYTIGQQFHTGEHSALYEACFSCDGGSAKAVVRVAHESSDNPFLNNEIRILDRLHRRVADKELGYWRYLPYVFGRFSAGQRTGVVYRWFQGVTATDIRMNALHKDGLDQRHVIWIFDRTINLLGYAHNRGIVHGRIEPDRLRVRPSNHNVMVTGWSHAVYKPATTGEQVRSGAENPFLAPEVNSTGAIGPWTDIYSLGKSMIWLLGGDPSTNQMPDTVHEKLQHFLLNTVREKPQARPQDAWRLYKAQNRLKDTLWERRFLHLDLA